MATRYLFLSLPTHVVTNDREARANCADSFWDEFCRCLSSLHVPMYRWTVPDFRGITIDILDEVADSLNKLNLEVQILCNNIHQCIMEIESLSAAKEKEPTVTVGGLSVEDYVAMFLWDENIYPIESPIKNLVSIINSKISKIESDMKVKRANYDDIQRKLRAVNKKQCVASLRDIDFYSLLQPEDIVISQNLVTLLIIVPITAQEKWLSSYEFIDKYVVPRSSKKIYEDHDNALYTVTLFAKVVPNFKDRARENNFQVSDFVFSFEAYESRKQEIEDLFHNEKVTKASLLQWYYGSYGEVFSGWMHVITMLVFSESVLRYGPSAGFLSAVIVPSMDNERKIRKALDGLCGGGGEKSPWKSEDSGDEFAFMGMSGQTDPYQYVSFSINVV